MIQVATSSDPVAYSETHLHHVAQELCFEVYRDWRYDPGSMEYDWVFLAALHGATADALRRQREAIGA